MIGLLGIGWTKNAGVKNKVGTKIGGGVEMT